MKLTLALITLCGLVLIAGPTKPNIPTYHPGDPIYLMELDKKTGELVVNDDDGKYLGTIDPEGKLRLAPKTKQETFFLELVNALREGTPKDEATQGQLQACKEILNELLPTSPVTNGPAQRNNKI